MELPDLHTFDQLLLVALGKLIERQLPDSYRAVVGRMAVEIAEEAYKQRTEALRRIEDAEPTPGVSQEVGAVTRPASAPTSGEEL